jgi:hypothetical protein
MVLASAGHLAEYLDGHVDPTTLERQPHGLGVQRGLEQQVGGGHLAVTNKSSKPRAFRDR